MRKATTRSATYRTHHSMPITSSPYNEFQVLLRLECAVRGGSYRQFIRIEVVFRTDDKVY